MEFIGDKKKTRLEGEEKTKTTTETLITRKYTNIKKSLCQIWATAAAMSFMIDVFFGITQLALSLCMFYEQLHSSPRQRQQSKTKREEIRTENKRCQQITTCTGEAAGCSEWCSLTFDSLAGWRWRLEANSYDAWSSERKGMYSLKNNKRFLSRPNVQLVSPTKTQVVNNNNRDNSRSQCCLKENSTSYTTVIHPHWYLFRDELMWNMVGGKM